MGAQQHAFGANLDLTCRLRFGDGSQIELSGTTLSIDPQTVVVSVVQGAQVPYPSMGDSVLLQVQLPAAVGDKAKCLAVRARVVKIRDMNNGRYHFTLTFRKASFREVPAGQQFKTVNGTDWQM